MNTNASTCSRTGVVWQRYANRSGTSPIRRFAIDAHGLSVEFVGIRAYRYDYADLDAETLDTLKRCALRGEGLATAIRRYAYRNFAYRLWQSDESGER